MVKIWYLKQFQFFSGLSDEELSKLENLIRIVRVARKQFLYFPEDPSDSVYLLKEGRVKISKISDDGKEITLAILEPGEIFGELAILDEGPRQTLAEALDDALIYAINRQDFIGFIETKPDLAFRLTKLIGLRRREIESKIEELVFRDVPSRLATLLIQLASNHGMPDQKGMRLNLKLTHQDLGNLIGSTRETTTTWLNEFRKKGFIDFDRRQIIVCDLKELKEFSEFH